MRAAEHRDDETGARGLGVNVFRSKLWVYIIAAFGTGVTGAVIYLNLLRLQPEAGFGLNWSALMIFAVVIGGLGTIEGPIIGAIIYFALQQLLSDYGTWYLILIGALARETWILLPPTALVYLWERRLLRGQWARLAVATLPAAAAAATAAASSYSAATLVSTSRHRPHFTRTCSPATRTSTSPRPAT